MNSRPHDTAAAWQIRGLNRLSAGDGVSADAVARITRSCRHLRVPDGGCRIPAAWQRFGASGLAAPRPPDQGKPHAGERWSPTRVWSPPSSSTSTPTAHALRPSRPL